MDWNIVLENLPSFADGFIITLKLAVISLLVGLLLAVPLAMMRVSKHALLWVPAYGYIFYFRGTPLLVQLFLIYYGSGQFRLELDSLGLWGWFRDAYFCALLTLTLNTCAYTAEIFRGAILAVPRGEIEAAIACGMSKLLRFRRIIFPKAFRLALPAYGNEVVFLLQATSLVSTITLLDITGVARRLVAKTFAVYEVYIAAAIMYLIMTYLLVFLFKKLEARMSTHLQPSKGFPKPPLP